MTTEPNPNDLRAAFIEVAKLGVLAQHFQDSLQKLEKDLEVLGNKDDRIYEELSGRCNRMSDELSAIRVTIAQLGLNEELREAKERSRLAPMERQWEIFVKAVSAIALALFTFGLGVFWENHKSDRDRAPEVQQSPHPKSRR